ncbi:hypothetical protein DUI87_04379 [Hirundo rustica rustica]|uniref:Uncharacterized protein n=1 Tax=Hirundo rustica rustica TaxID=333673 RepID=A0A3M0L638_HIRRU|nr:hypothetical protein DUI87_04379 [Hirundo rustica rustica]
MNRPNPLVSGPPGVIEFELENEATSRQEDDRESRDEELLFSKNLKSKCASLTTEIRSALFRNRDITKLMCRWDFDSGQVKPEVKGLMSSYCPWKSSLWPGATIMEIIALIPGGVRA